MDLRDVKADVEMEKKILSALMLNEGEAIPSVSTLLKPDDFYRPEHRKIYQALTKLSDKGEPIDVLLVMDELKRMRELEKITRRYVLGLLNLEYTTARAQYYATIIKNYSKMRQLTEIGQQLAEDAQNERGSVEAILAALEKKITALTSATVQNVTPAKDVLLEAYKNLNERQGGLLGITTGLIDLNKVTNGLKKSDLIILAARPSMGKTALALNIAVNAAHEHNVLLFSLEMSKGQLAQRMLSAESRVAASRIQTGNLSDDDRQEIVSAVDRLSNLELYFDDTAAITLSDLRTKARRMKREQGLDLIVVDYLQLMQASKEYRGNRVQEVSELSRGLKALARELDIPVMVLSQLSRSVELRAEKKPQLSDLRESGSIEQDADIVMFLYREEYYNREVDNSVAELIVAKNRNGATTSIRLYFDRDIQKFNDLTRRQND